MNELQRLKQYAQEAINGHKKAVAGLYHDGVPKYEEGRMSRCAATSTPSVTKP